RVFRPDDSGQTRSGLKTRRHVRTDLPTLSSDLHVGNAPLLDHSERHDMRRDETHSWVQAGKQVCPNLRDRQLPGLRELLGTAVERDVALPEDRAARLQRLDA